MITRTRTVAALAVALTLTSWQPSVACLHLPATYEGSIEQLAQGGLIVYHQGVEDLILNNTFLVTGAARPESVAWVVPVPTKPMSYSVVEDASLFKDLFDTWDEDESRVRDRTGTVLWEPPPSYSFGTLGGAKGIDLLEQHSVGPYEIAVIQASDADALNAWLAKKGFGTVPPQNMSFYIDNGHTWVCVKTRPEGMDGEFKPLRMRFQTPKIVYPLKFSSHQGTFNVNLYVVTDEPLPLPVSKNSPPGADRISLSGHTVPGQTQNGFDVSGRWFALPESAAKLAKERGLRHEVGTKVPYLTKISARQLVGAGVSEWTTDLEFTPPPGAETPPQPVICFPDGPQGQPAGHPTGGITEELEQQHLVPPPELEQRKAPKD